MKTAGMSTREVDARAREITETARPEFANIHSVQHDTTVEAIQARTQQYLDVERHTSRLNDLFASVASTFDGEPKIFPSIIPVHESAGEQKTALLEGLREMIVGEDGIFKALAKDIENAGSIGEKLIISEKIIALLDADVSPKLASVIQTEKNEVLIQAAGKAFELHEAALAERDNMQAKLIEEQTGENVSAFRTTQLIAIDTEDKYVRANLAISDGVKDPDPTKDDEILYKNLQTILTMKEAVLIGGAAQVAMTYSEQAALSAEALANVIADSMKGALRDLAQIDPRHEKYRDAKTLILTLEGVRDSALVAAGLIDSDENQGLGQPAPLQSVAAPIQEEAPPEVIPVAAAEPVPQAPASQLVAEAEPPIAPTATPREATEIILFDTRSNISPKGAVEYFDKLPLRIEKDFDAGHILKLVEDRKGELLIVSDKPNKVQLGALYSVVSLEGGEKVLFVPSIRATGNAENLARADVDVEACKTKMIRQLDEVAKELGAGRICMVLDNRDFLTLAIEQQIALVQQGMSRPESFFKVSHSWMECPRDSKPTADNGANPVASEYYKLVEFGSTTDDVPATLSADGLVELSQVVGEKMYPFPKYVALFYDDFSATAQDLSGGFLR